MLRKALCARKFLALRALAASPSALALIAPKALTSNLGSAFHSPGGLGLGLIEPPPDATADAAAAVASAGDVEASSSVPPAQDTSNVKGGIDQSAGESFDFDDLSAEEFGTLADLYFGGFTTRIERGMREAEGEEFEFEVKPDRGAMLVLLPYDGQMRIRKDPHSRRLVVESNLFEPYEDKDCQVFRPISESSWINEDEQTLDSFVSEALSKYLRAQVKI